MTHTFKLARRGARFRVPMLATALAFALGACDADKVVDPAVAGPAESVVAVEAPTMATTFRGGIPFGTFAQPTSDFGEIFNGAMQNNAPTNLLRELVAIKARGGKVILMFAGNERHYKTNGYFDLRKWKARIDRFRNVNFNLFINDGTIVGHYLIDEPNDPNNWHGRPVPPSVLEEMARYSKQHWPNMTTIVRVEPGYLNANPRYIDAAWAQYHVRRGSAAEYIRRNVASAQSKGLGLIVGMNLLRGGANHRPMSASQVREFGSVLLGSSYPCAFISWQYNANFLQPSSMRDAMRTLRGRAQNRSMRSCRGGA